MRTITKAALAGIASLALAAPLAAQTLHTMRVALPDGGVAQIRYAGDVPPQVELVPAPAPLLAAWPAFPDFADFARIEAAMNQEARALLQQVATLAAQPGFAPGGPLAIDFANLPPGVTEYAVSSVSNGNGWCSQSIEVTRNGPNAAPQVVRHSAGNCAATPNGGVPAPVQAQPQHDQPQRLMVRNEQTRQPMDVQQVAWRR